MGITSTTNHLQEKLLKAAEVAETLNVSQAMAYKLMQTYAIPTVRIGSVRRVRPIDLQGYINDNLTSRMVGK
ncbi:MAG: helix-turn-helix domain-containing protein [Chloroflexi bacterium]|nr:helix-turn-helix domain-containing protein [Chloroflexota bacterium]MBU1660433.1 helix-turn-helix domain-containing protein [Chloroflexota bacterium]